VALEECARFRDLDATSNFASSTALHTRPEDRHSSDGTGEGGFGDWFVEQSPTVAAHR
jgi:hypothetical protein